MERADSAITPLGGSAPGSGSGGGAPGSGSGGGGSGTDWTRELLEVSDSAPTALYRMFDSSRM